MLSRIGIICFAGSYGVSLVLELSRLFFRSGVRGAVMLGFAAAGLLAHTVYLCHEAYEAVGASQSPLSTERDWYLVAAWVLAALYLVLTYTYPRVPFGLFILPLVLGLIAAATFWANTQPYPKSPRLWGIVHGTSILAATVAVFVGFIAGLMYLSQAWRLKTKRPPPRGLRLPSLEWLQHANSRAIVVSLLMLGVGVLSGVVLNRIRTGRGLTHLPLTDPVVLSTVGMLGWLLIAAAITVFYRPARVGRKVAYLTLVSFVFLVVALAVSLFTETEHGGKRSAGRAESPEVRVEGSGSGVDGSSVRVQGSGLGVQDVEVAVERVNPPGAFGGHWERSPVRGGERFGQLYSAYHPPPAIRRS